ncbi:MAG: hypothetical protein Hyperionvirus7_49 [Hyperionvirus sp.]|uniref:Uncharacterized protein n=1 Tax=Hyperionvirus sp. TaxID=2487770 RepID=A0A3G5A8C3_9VIRU|nr:MAG: hypothetical protein Hyperionvirus7_49 [Hyperionvirus sp.]
MPDCFQNVSIRLDEPFIDSNPAGNARVTQVGDYIYVGSLNFMNIYSLRTKARLASISLIGYTPRARPLPQNRLLILTGTSLILFDNTDPFNPQKLASITVGGGVIDFVLSEDNSVAYVLHVSGLDTVEISALDTLTITDTFQLVANVAAGIYIEFTNQALYVGALTHNLLYVFDIRNTNHPKNVQQIYNNLAPSFLTQTVCFPTMLISSGIFGIIFYDIADPFDPIEIDQHQTGFLNVIAAIPGTNYVANSVFSPENKLVIAELLIQKSTSGKIKCVTYNPINSVKLQSGRLPSDTYVIPSVTNNNKYQIIVPNSYEPMIQVGKLKFG